MSSHERQADGSFTQSDHDGGAIELRAINCTLPIAEVYEDLPIAGTSPCREVQLAFVDG